MTKEKLELINKYYSIQNEILDSLEELNTTVQKIIGLDSNNNDNISNNNDNNNNDDIYYMLRYDYYTKYGKKRYKYIQIVKYYDSRPSIVTDQGYRAGTNVLFKSKKVANDFFKRFMTSKSRRYPNDYTDGQWKIIEKDLSKTKYKISERYDNEYGYYFVG